MTVKMSIFGMVLCIALQPSLP